MDHDDGYIFTGMSYSLSGVLAYLMVLYRLFNTEWNEMITYDKECRMNLSISRYYHSPYNLMQYKWPFPYKMIYTGLCETFRQLKILMEFQS